MRTIVVFEAGDKLLYTELSDLPVVPTIGYTLEHEGASFEVVSVHMSPAVFTGERNKDGSEIERSGFRKLLAILSRFNAGKSKTAIEMIATMQSIGRGDRPAHVGQIELPNKLAPQYDDVIYLRTRQVGQPSAKAIRTELSLIKHYTAKGYLSAADTASGGENIVLTDAAAK
jgi:hypothetical protein